MVLELLHLKTKNIFIAYGVSSEFFGHSSTKVSEKKVNASYVYLLLPMEVPGESTRLAQVRSN